MFVVAILCYTVLLEGEEVVQGAQASMPSGAEPSLILETEARASSYQISIPGMVVVEGGRELFPAQ